METARVVAGEAGRVAVAVDHLERVRVCRWLLVEEDLVLRLAEAELFICQCHLPLLTVVTNAKEDRDSSFQPQMTTSARRRMPWSRTLVAR